MSVVPMKLLTIAGPLERFDDVVRACVIDQEFHPENALQLMRSVKGLRPLELENPYSALLHRSVEVADEAGIPLAYAPFDPASPLEDFASYFDSLSGRIAALHRRREELEHKADEARSMVDQLQNLRGLNVSLDELWGLDHARFRYGYLPRETYDGFREALNEEEDIFFVPTTLGARRVYGVYFTTKEAHHKVDSLFNSLHFVRIRLEDPPGGTVDNATAELNAQVEAAQAAVAQVGQELEELRRKEAVENASASEARALLSALAAAAQELLDRDEAVHQELSAGEERVRQLQEGRDAAQKELAQAREDRDSLQNVLNGYGLRLESRRKKAKEAEERHVKLQMEENALHSRIHMLSEMEKLYEGYSKAVKLVMGEARRGQLKGVHGPVAGLLHVPDHCTVAIETALGGAMQHIVVEREEDGKAAIQYLKRRDGGRSTFLPLTTIRPSDFREQGVRGEAGFVGLGDELVQFDPRYQRIFSNLLGRTVVAEDMDAAIAMARKYGHRFKIVTLDGQVLNPGGSMTGGSVSRSAGILSRANELERLNRQRAGVEEQRTAAAQAMEEARREATAAAYEVETAQAQQRQHEDAILKLEERLAHFDAQLADASRRRDEQRRELEQIQARSAQTEADTAAARARIEALEGSAAALRAEAEGKAQGQSELQARTAGIREAIAELNMRRAGLEAEQQAAGQSLTELEALRRDLTGDRAEREQMLTAFEEKNAALEEEILEKERRLQAIRQENRERQEAIARINEEKLALEARRNQADKQAREKNSELLNLEREVSVLEQRKAAAALEEKTLLDKLWETYELSHEAARAQRVELESVPKAQRRVGELKKAISGLGNINLDAIEEFQRVNERYTYLTDQRDDVLKSKKELEGIIADITEEMKTIFARQFSVINEAFQQTFTELFGGGKATLELEEPEDILNCGIEIRVQPPGKALKVLSLLSGGEKAFVAIALYFAILKVRPTPFCVMDEIEAALDDANVVRFARYMRQMADKTQFIVITHRRGTMEEADVLYGVTMQEQGVSRILTINLNDVEKELHIK